MLNQSILNIVGETIYFGEQTLDFQNLAFVDIFEKDLNLFNVSVKYIERYYKDGECKESVKDFNFKNVKSFHLSALIYDIEDKDLKGHLILSYIFNNILDFEPVLFEDVTISEVTKNFEN